MSSSLNVIALISGGKDSLFSILHCLENGHRVVALANLYPSQNNADAKEGAPCSIEAQTEAEDLNSFMYQTVGHSVIHLYPECLGIPLYRRAITGSAVQTGRYYDASSLASEADETEDLIHLLKDAMRAHPEANALCSGAILSTYQRTRVESVAVRLGLTSLAYLWQYPALAPPIGRGESLTGLLDDMAAAGCDARIIKIASGGIKENLMWSNVADSTTGSRLLNGLQPFFPDNEFWLRGAVLGEGGEYETLAINGPRRLWKKRIEIPEQQMSTMTGEGGVSYLRFSNARAVEHQPLGIKSEPESLQLPQALDSQFRTVMTLFNGQETLIPRESTHGVDQAETKFPRRSLNDPLTVATNLTKYHTVIINCTASSLDSPTGDGTAIAQMKQICHYLKSSLNTISGSSGSSEPLTPSGIVSTMLLLRDMSNFSGVNSVYASLFRAGEPNPPARVTIACSLPEGVEVSLSVILDLGPRDARRGLHVQSRSYWAPANIGPYSQAICVPLDRGDDQVANIHDAGQVEMVHVAGQIPLVPHIMQILEADLSEQAVLSLQHLWRVGQERGVDIWPWGIAFLAGSPDGAFRAELACRVWQEPHFAGTRPVDATAEDRDEAEGGPDAWDLQYNHALSYEVTATQSRPGQHLHILPNSAVLENATAPRGYVPPFIAAEVSSLPRNSPIEWWSMGLAGLPKRPGYKPRASVTHKDHQWGAISKVTVLPSSNSPTEQSIYLVTVLINQATTSASSLENFACIESDLLALLSPNDSLGEETSRSANTVHGTAFISTHGSGEWSRVHEHQHFKDLVQIPCKSVYGWSDPEAGKPDEHDLRRVNSKAMAGEPPTTSTSMRNVRARSTSALMTPLAVAITMRIDR